MTEQTQNLQTEQTSGESVPASELFAELVLRQTQLALVLLGKLPHPESGTVKCDLEQARVAIDLLEMLELKTKGNLTKEEETLLKQSLMTVRMAFVEAADLASNQSAGKQAVKSKEQSVTQATDQPDEQPRKRFVKKYG